MRKKKGYSGEEMKRIKRVPSFRRINVYSVHRDRRGKMKEYIEKKKRWLRVIFYRTSDSFYGSSGGGDWRGFT